MDHTILCGEQNQHCHSFFLNYYKSNLSKTLPTCIARCCPPDPPSPSDPSHFQSRGSLETSSVAGPSVAWWHQGQNYCCYGAAGAANPPQQRRWSRRSSAGSSGGVSWGAYQPETNESPHSTERGQRERESLVQTNVSMYSRTYFMSLSNLISMPRLHVLRNIPDCNDLRTTGERGVNWCSLARGLR